MIDKHKLQQYIDVIEYTNNIDYVHEIIDNLILYIHDNNGFDIDFSTIARYDKEHDEIIITLDESVPEYQVLALLSNIHKDFTLRDDPSMIEACFYTMRKAIVRNRDVDPDKILNFDLITASLGNITNHTSALLNQTDESRIRWNQRFKEIMKNINERV